jgi:putative phosphoribosyl transferase
MNFAFENRVAAGKALADLLRHYTHDPNLLVMALPRGGVPVAFEVAQALGAELDVMVVRKLGVPEQEELAFGAIASGGVQVLNDDVVAELEMTQADMAPIVARQRHELLRRERLYRSGRPVPNVAGRTVILVDDGIATGATMRAAIHALRERHVGHLVVAVPVVALQTARKMQPEVDEWVAALTPTHFWGVARWYYDFSQTTDQEVIALLQRAAHIHRPPAHLPHALAQSASAPAQDSAGARPL